MIIKMADQVPPTRIRCRHQRGQHLAGVHRDGGGPGPGVRVVEIVAVQVVAVCLGAHGIKVPDDAVIDAHFKGRVVGVDVAIQLHVQYVSVILPDIVETKGDITG